MLIIIKNDKIIEYKMTKYTRIYYRTCRNWEQKDKVT